MTDQPASIQSLTQKLIEFRDARDWEQFHSLKELILSLNLEAGELLELTQWQSADQFDAAMRDKQKQQDLQDECADVFVYLMLIAERAGFDLCEAADRKIAANAAKYPIDQARGKAVKYDQLP